MIRYYLLHHTAPKYLTNIQIKLIIMIIVMLVIKMYTIIRTAQVSLYVESPFETYVSGYVVSPFEAYIFVYAVFPFEAYVYVR